MTDLPALSYATVGIAAAPPCAAEEAPKARDRRPGVKGPVRGAFTKEKKCEAKWPVFS